MIVEQFAIFGLDLEVILPTPESCRVKVLCTKIR